MPEFRFSNGSLLARAVEVLLPLAKEGIINYTPEELSLVVSEPSGVLKAALRINSSGFTLFDCNVNSSARVNLEELHKELNRSSGDDALTIYGGDGNYIRFQYHNTSTEDSLYSEMKLTQIYDENMDINELKNIYEAGVMIHSEGFRNLFRHLRQFGSTVRTTVKKSYVIFEVEGVETAVSTWRNHCYIMSSFAQGDFLCSIFNLDHMRSFQSASLLSNQVWIFSSGTFNCMLYYPVAEGCFINFFFYRGCDKNL